MNRDALQEMPQMISTDTVAEHMDVDSSTVRRLCKKGEIEGARKIGRQWRIPVTYLTERKQAA